ncbi:MAG: hypothetical protein ACOCVM_03360 [Desulfovibrionaceae bacterium]
MRTLMIGALLALCLLAGGCSEEPAKDQPEKFARTSPSQNLTASDLQVFLEVYPRYLRWAESQPGDVAEEDVQSFFERQSVDPARFQWIMERVMLGYMAISLDDELPRLEQRIEQLDRTRREILSDGAVNERQKKDIREQFDELLAEQRSMLERLRTFSESERELLLEHESEVEALLKESLKKEESP